MDTFSLILLMVLAGLLGISSLYISANTNAAYVAKKARKYEGVIGLILLLAGLQRFIGTAAGFHAGAWHIISSIFTLFACLATIGLGGVFFLTFFQPSPDAPALGVAMPAVPPVIPAEGVPPAIPVAPAALPSANALAGLKLPLGFAVLGFAFLLFVFSFFHGGGPVRDPAAEFAEAMRHAIGG